MINLMEGQYPYVQRTTATGHVGQYEVTAMSSRSCTEALVIKEPCLWKKRLDEKGEILYVCV